MSITAVVGANWGDEGKGKVTDVLAADANYVVRYQGGSNAGHTIINSFGKFALRLLPSGVFHPEVINVIGTGVALDISILLAERDALLARGIPEPLLRISDRAQVVMPYHKLFDALEEERLGDLKFGSTKTGIAPFYADKYLKLGIQVADLFDVARLTSRIKASLIAKNSLLVHLYGKHELHVEDIVPLLLIEADRIKPYVCNTAVMLQEALKRKETILVEGQLGALRDPDHGIYPHSTSSSTLAAFAAVGAGLPPNEIQRIVGVVKAYSTCVGAGPFTAEIAGEEADELRKRGGDAGEYGVNTGRPRRMGWFDVMATRYGCMLQGATEVVLTNLDVLGYLSNIPICAGYELDGARLDAFPASVLLERVKPVIEYFAGWLCDISTMRKFEQLPQQAQDYVTYIEQHIGVRITCISVGPDRAQMIYR